VTIEEEESVVVLVKERVLGLIAVKREAGAGNVVLGVLVAKKMKKTNDLRDLNHLLLLVGNEDESLFGIKLLLVLILLWFLLILVQILLPPKDRHVGFT